MKRHMIVVLTRFSVPHRMPQASCVAQATCGVPETARAQLSAARARCANSAAVAALRAEANPPLLQPRSPSPSTAVARVARAAADNSTTCPPKYQRCPRPLGARSHALLSLIKSPSTCCVTGGDMIHTPEVAWMCNALHEPPRSTWRAAKRARPWQTAATSSHPAPEERGERHR